MATTDLPEPSWFHHPPPPHLTPEEPHPWLIAPLNGFDIDLAADQTRLASRLRDALTSISPALERAGGRPAAPSRVRDQLVKHPTLTALRAASQSRIEQTVKPRSPRIAAKVTTAIAAALAAQDVTVTAEAATGRVIAALASELDRVCARCDRLAGEIEEAFLAHPFGELLATMPGIGPRTGARILAEIGNGSAFRDGGKLAAYADLAPVTRQSGTSLAGETAAAAATTSSRTPCSWLRCRPRATRRPRRSTTASAPKANATTPP